MAGSKKIFTPRVLVQLLVFVFLPPFLPLLISWRWDWWEAWLYAAIGILGFVASRVAVARRNPDLLAERAHSMQQENIQSWDKILSPLVGIGGGLIPLVAGLDARFDWPPAFSMPVKIIALALFLAGYALGAYALVENRFFSGTVRIQTERGHQVISSGPYAWIRHPGYAGALLSFLATPVFLDAAWSLLPALFLAVVLVIRTRLEDRMLQEQLEGYRAYAGRVRYRLIPGVW